MRKRTYPAGNDAASRSRKAGRHLCSPSAVCGSAHNVGGQFVPSSQAALQEQYPHLSQQKVVAGTGAFFLLSRSSERRFFHEVRSQHPLQNLPGRECASAELIQRICRHEGEVRAAAQSGHRKVHDGRRLSGAFCDGLVATIPGRSLFPRKSRTFIRCTIPLPWYRLTAAAEAAAIQEEYHDVLLNILHSVQADFAGIPQFPGNES